MHIKYADDFIATVDRRSTMSQVLEKIKHDLEIKFPVVLNAIGAFKSDLMYFYDNQSNRYVDVALSLEKIRKRIFQMTGGGITFDGGEPLLNNEFIHQFCKIANPAWKIRVETSLNVLWEKVKLLLSDVDLWFIDIKDLNENIYRKYTGTGNKQVIENLMKLDAMISQERICIRVPLISGYNTEKDIDNSLSILKKFRNIDRLTYIQ